MFGASFSSGLGSVIVDTITLAGVDQYAAGLGRLSRAHAEFQNRASRSNAIGTIGAGLTLGVTAPLLGLLGKSGQLGMEAVESENLVKQSFGNMYGDISKWSDKAARDLGLNAYEMRRQAGTLKQMFTGAGFDAGTATKMSKTFTDAKNDLVSFFNVADNDAIRDLQSGLAGETEPLRKYGIFITENTIKTFAWQKGLAAQGKELTEQQKIVARYNYILDRLKANNVLGDLARTKDSPANQLRRTQAEFTADLTKFGISALPVMQDALRVARAFLPPVSKAVDLFEKLPEPAREFGLALAIGTGPLLSLISKLPSLKQGLDALGIGKKPGGITGPTAMSTPAMHVRAQAVYVNGPVVGGRGGGGFPDVSLPLPMPRLPGGGGTPGPLPLPGPSGGSGVGGYFARLWERFLAIKAPSWALRAARAVGPYTRPFFEAGGARLIPSGILGYMAGTRASGDLQRLGYSRAASNTYGTVTGLGIAGLGLWNPLTMLGAAGGLIGRHLINKYYNAPMELAARGDLRQHEIAALAQQSMRDKADFYNTKAAEALKRGDEVTAESYRLEALKWLRLANENKKRAQMAQGVNPQDWVNQQWAANQAARQRQFNAFAAAGGPGAARNVDKATAAVLAQYGFVVPSDLPAGSVQPALTRALPGERSAPTVTAVRRRDDASRITIALPPGNGDRMAQDVKYQAMAPAQIGF